MRERNINRLPLTHALAENRTGDLFAFRDDALPTKLKKQ